MSREIRRVPVDWQHPTAPNPYWLEQTASALLRRETLSRLHLPQDRFVGLMGNYQDALGYWQREVDEVASRSGHHWTFQVEYHLTGFKGHDETEPTVHPFYAWADDETEVEIVVRDEDHLHELATAKVADEKPNPDDYMPQFDGDADSLGWCLYETVSEGTPITPVFATAEELIDHLVEYGEDWRQEPYRRESAEALVNGGGSFGSMFFVGGVLYDGARDLDRIAEVSP